MAKTAKRRFIGVYVPPNKAAKDCRARRWWRFATTVNYQLIRDRSALNRDDQTERPAETFIGYAESAGSVQQSQARQGRRLYVFPMVLRGTGSASRLLRDDVVTTKARSRPSKRLQEESRGKSKRAWNAVWPSRI